MTKSPLSERVQELIQKARIVSFSTWQNIHPPEVIERFQRADDEGRYLTDEDLQEIQQLAPSATALIPAAQHLRDQVTEIVEEARSKVINTFPNILQVGGGLYPSERAEACWRDFWHFLRCITYGIAGEQTHYTSPEGLHAMQLLYQELQVPLKAMVVGMEGIKEASLIRVLPQQQAALTPYFDHLIEQLKKFD